MGLELKFLRISPNTKRPIDKFSAPKEYDEVKHSSDLGLIVPNGYVVIDVDEQEQANALQRIIENLGLKSKNYADDARQALLVQNQQCNN